MVKVPISNEKFRRFDCLKLSQAIQLDTIKTARTDLQKTDLYGQNFYANLVSFQVGNI